MVSTRGIVPWHRGGVVLPGDVTFADAPRIAGLDFTVAMVQVYGPDNVPILSHRAIQRQDNGRIYGVVSKNYREIQPGDVFDVASDLPGARVETAGLLLDGTMWLMVDVGEDREIAGEEHRVRLLLVNGLGGNVAFRGALTTIRAVCENTVIRGLGAAESKIRIKHVGDVKGKVSDAAERLAGIKMAADRFAELGGMLSRVRMSDRAVRLMLGKLLPDPPADATDRAKESAAHRRGEILDGFRGAYPGSDTRAAAGTAWGAFQAVTHYVDHKRMVPQSAETKGVTVAQIDRRWRSCLLGTGEQIKQSALRLVVSLAA